MDIIAARMVFAFLTNNNAVVIATASKDSAAWKERVVGSTVVSASVALCRAARPDRLAVGPMGRKGFAPNASVTETVRRAASAWTAVACTPANAAPTAIARRAGFAATACAFSRPSACQTVIVPT